MPIKKIGLTSQNCGAMFTVAFRGFGWYENKIFNSGVFDYCGQYLLL